MMAHILLGGELLGAGLILLAYWANAGGRWSRRSIAYLGVNLVGALLLGIIALHFRRWGFVLLEIVWVAISIQGLLRRSSPPRPLEPDTRETG